MAEFSGVLAEDGLRDFIRRLVPAPEDLMFAKGKNLLLLAEYDEAEDAFREFLAVHPAHPEANLGLIRTLLFQGKGVEAVHLLRHFPASPVYGAAQLLKPVAEAYQNEDLNPVDADSPLEAAFRNGIRLAKNGNILAGMDGFLDILRKDKGYRKGQAKDIFVGWLTLIGDEHPESRQYRQDLSAVLF
ncbi:MAG: tetratricopeptide repeat protein [Anaerolineaceae bacterium]|nr:tetratricopeptide repeat protein [Anaerolineaceae bacterium]